MELVVQSGPDAGKVFQVGRTPLVAGRQAGTDILLNDVQVSRRHASFELVNGFLLVSDLGSANGTKVNGQRMAPNQAQSLAPGDQVTLGNTTFVIRQSAGTPPTDETMKGGPADPFGVPPGPAPSAYNPAPGAPPAYGQAASFSAPGAEPSYQPASNFQPATGYQPASNFQVPANPAYPPLGSAPVYNPPPPPVKKSQNGLLIGGIIGIVALAGAAIAAILLIGGSKTDSTPTPGIFIPATSSVEAITTPTTGPSPTPVIGQSGTNPLPPPPPAAGVSPTPRPTTAASGSASANGVVAALGITIKFPTNWKTVVDEGKNIIEGGAPDGVTYTQVRRISGVKGSASDRLTAYLNSVNQSLTDMKIIREVKAANNNLADAYITYTDKDDQLLHRDYVVAAGTGEDTYFIRFSTEDTKFDGQVPTFNDILSSISI